MSSFRAKNTYEFDEAEATRWIDEILDQFAVFAEQELEFILSQVRRYVADEQTTAAALRCFSIVQLLLR